MVYNSGYEREERRKEQRRNHERNLDDIDKLKAKANKLSGWQKAQASFIALCFASIVLFSMKTNESVAQVVLSAAKIDKQVAMLISGNQVFKRNQKEINVRTYMDIKELKLNVHNLQLACQQVRTQLDK